MSLRSHCIFLLAGVAAILPGQDLPWYLSDQYPARSATGVPTNTSIQLVEASAAAKGGNFYGFAFSLMSQTGATVALGNAAVYYTNVSITPTAALAPSTLYTFTVTPPASQGDPYFFDFTTGSGPDTAGPQFAGFSPPSGTMGSGTSGPFTALFNKRLGIVALNGQAVSVRVPGGYTEPANISLTSDGKGLVIAPSPQGGSGNYWPGSYQITVDPTKLQDASGNAGQGTPQTAQYVTFAAQETSGPALKSFFPADGDGAIPLNVSVRLLFSHAIDPGTAATGIVLDSGGTAAPAHFNSFASGYGVEVKSTNLLAANRTYRVSVTTALLDQAGLAAQPASFQFTTGSDADVTAAQAVDSGPSYGPVWPSNALIALRANKRIMPLAAVEYSTLGSPPLQGIAAPTVAGTATISSDEQTFIFVPATPPAAGQSLNVSLADVVDVTGAAFTLSGVDYMAGGAADHAPPSVLAVSPPDGTQGVSTTAPVQAGFSEPISIALSGDFPRLSTNGQRVTAKFTFNGTALTLASPSPLQPNTSYTLDLGGASDQSGNAMGPYSVQFTTGAAPVTGAVQLLSTSPAASATGVVVNTSISFTFDSPLNPVAAISGFTVSDSTFGIYPATATVANGTLTITPTHALLHDSVIQASVNTTDVGGRYAYGQILFRTGPNGDTSAFQVVSVSPPIGAVISGSSRSITLTFNKAVNPASLTGGAITLYWNGQPVQATVTRANQDLSLVVSGSGINTGSAILVVDPELTDIAGNPAIPFRASYTFAAPSGSVYPSVLAMRPPSGSTGVPASTSISLFFSQPVDLAAVRASLVVVADGLPVAGAFEASADGATVTFRPSAPFAAGAQVRFFQGTLLFSDTYGFNFTIAAAPASTLSMTRYAPVGGGPSNAVIEVEFSSDVATGQNLISLHLTGYPNPGAVVPTIESHPRPFVLRLTPVSPLAPGNYLLVISPEVGSAGYLSLQMTAPVTSPPLTMLAGPAPNTIGLPVNVSVRAALNTPLNPLSVVAGNLTIQAGGRTIPSLIYLSGDGLSLALTPTEALPANRPIGVAMSGLEDQYGNAVAPKSWSFTTAAGPDFSTPVLLQSNISSTNAIPQLPANSAVVFQFDRPLDPQATDLRYQRISPQIQAVYTLSDDLRTLTVTPATWWARGQQYSFYFYEVEDLAGNGFNAPYFNFTVAFDPDLTPPKLLAVSPADGQTGLPLNANIIASFDKPVAGGSFGLIRLMQADAPRQSPLPRVAPGAFGAAPLRRGAVGVPLVTMQDDLQRARLAPATPLQPDTTYMLLVEGVADLSGNIMAGTATLSFTTGELMDDTFPVATVYAGAATNIPIRLLFSEPVSPATVDSRSVSLSKASSNGGSYYWIPIPSTPVLSADGLSVTVTPRDALTPGWQYDVAVGYVRDFAGNRASPTSGATISQTFYEGYAPDTTPPTVIVVPVDGSTGVPVNTRLGVVFSKTIYPQAAASIFRLTTNGLPVSGKFTQSGNGIFFTTDFPLTPGATYRIDIASVTDLAGNVSTPVSSTFTMANSAVRNLSPLRLLSSTPADGNVGVPVNSPIVLNFSALVDPTSVGGILIQSTFPANGAFSTSGSTVTFTPKEPWPSASSVTVYFLNRSLQDVAGNQISPTNGLSFKTAATPDPTPPQLLSVAPQAGTLLVPPAVAFQLAFSKTVAAGSGGLVVFSGNQQTTPTISYSPSDPHTLMVGATVPASSQLTLIGSDAIVDRAGNPLTPFSFQYPTGAAVVGAPPAVTSVTPNMGAAGVAPNTPIVLSFNKSMDPTSLSASVRVTEDGANITGKLGLLNSNTGVKFTPDNPYKAGSRIDVFVLETAADPSGLTLGQRYDAFFTVAGSTTSSMAVEQAGFGSVVAADAPLELAFDRPLDPWTVNADNVWLRVGRKLLRGEVSLRTDRIVRVVPSAPMEPGVEHVLTVGPGLRAMDGAAAQPEEFHFTPQTGASPAEVAAVEWTTLSGKTAVLVRFSAPVSSLTLDGVRLVAGDGAEISVGRQVSLDGREVWLTPQDGPQGRSVSQFELVSRSVRLVLDEVLDGAGRRIPPAVHRPQNAGRQP